MDMLTVGCCLNMLETSNVSLGPKTFNPNTTLSTKLSSFKGGEHTEGALNCKIHFLVKH